MARHGFRALACALALALLLGSAAADSGVGTEVDSLDAHCAEELNELWELYTKPNASADGCDSACLSQCYQVLTAAIYATKNKDCPLQTDIQRCFHYYSDQWEDYVKECELFSWDGTSAEGEGQAATSEGEASSSSESEAEASSPAPSSPSESESTAESGRRRRLLSSEGEGEGGLGGGGCFPDFQDPEEFEAYIDGNWVFNQPSNAAGIALSCAFFVGLAGLAWFIKA